MSLADKVKESYKAYKTKISSRNPDKKFLVATGLAAAAVGLDGLTTYVSNVQFSDFLGEGMKTQILWSTKHYMDAVGPALGLTMESTLTMGVAILGASVLNKIFTEDWSIGHNMVGKGKIIKNFELPKCLRKDWGTTFLYCLAGTSLAGCIHNINLYYQYFTDKLHF